MSISEGLTRRGRDRLEEAKAAATAKDADELVLVEHCAGIGAGRRALQLLGVRPGAHVVTEVSEPAVRVLKAAFPGAVLMGDLQEFSQQKLKEALNTCMEPKFFLKPQARHAWT